MAFYVDWTEKLQATRVWLQDVVTQGLDIQNYQKLTGMLNYLQSPLSGRVINTTMLNNSGNSEYRPVQIRYTPHKGEGNVIDDDSVASCAKVAQRRDIIAEYQPTLYVEDKFTIEEDYVRQNGENGFKLQQRLNMEFRESMRVLREKINEKLFAKAATVFGANPAQGTGAGQYTELTLLKTATGAIDDRYFDVIKNDQEDNYQMGAGDIGIVGLGQARRYMNRLAVGNANDAGIDYRAVAAEFGMVLFKDSYTNSVLGDPDNVLAFYPGAAQFYQYNLFRGDFAIKVTETHIKGTMPDPIFPGITYDYILKYDDNCETGNGLQGAWVGRVLTYFDLFTIPEGAFGDTYADLNDFNGIVGYKITQA